MASAEYAPAGPIQFPVAPPGGGGAETFHDASRGEYENKDAAISSATVIHKNPINSLSRLFPVGVRKRTDRFSSAGPPRWTGSLRASMPHPVAFWGRLIAAGSLALAAACVEELQNHQNHTKRLRRNHFAARKCSTSCPIAKSRHSEATLAARGWLRLPSRRCSGLRLTGAETPVAAPRYRMPAGK